MAEEEFAESEDDEQEWPAQDLQMMVGGKAVHIGVHFNMQICFRNDEVSILKKLLW